MSQKFINKSSLVCISVVKIPEILSSAPAPKFGDFWGFTPQNPRNFSFPRPQIIPEPMDSSNPVSIPKERGILGINPNISPKYELPPSPNYPLIFQHLYPRPHPHKTGIFGDGENQGSLGTNPQKSIGRRDQN